MRLSTDMCQQEIGTFGDANQRQRAQIIAIITKCAGYGLVGPARLVKILPAIRVIFVDCAPRRSRENPGSIAKTMRRSMEGGRNRQIAEPQVADQVGNRAIEHDNALAREGGLV